MKVTIKDVAKEANVATSTVSRVLTNSSRISEETKERVNNAIKKLNYTPNIMARSLANRRTNILAVLVPEIAENLFSNSFFIQVMKGISICAEKNNYFIMYAFKEKSAKSGEWIKKFTDNNLVDGLCLLRAMEDDEDIKYLKKINFPFVVIGRPADNKNILWVDNDNFRATYDLVIKLIDEGHEKIGFVGGKANLNVSIDRFNGYKEGLRSRGISMDSSMIYEGNCFDQKNGYLGGKKIISLSKPTAIIATDDLLAFGVQDALRELNLKNISVVGFNNNPLDEFRNPPLASVDINAEELGYYATELLINKLNNKNAKRKYYVIDTKLVERESF